MADFAIFYAVIECKWRFFCASFKINALNTATFEGISKSRNTYRIRRHPWTIKILSTLDPRDMYATPGIWKSALDRSQIPRIWEFYDWRLVYPNQPLSLGAPPPLLSARESLRSRSRAELLALWQLELPIATIPSYRIGVFLFPAPPGKT